MCRGNERVDDLSPELKFSQTRSRQPMKKTKLNLSTGWAEAKEKIKEANMQLTDEDLILIPGREQELLDSLSKKLNLTTDEVQAWIESVSANKGKAS